MKALEQMYNVEKGKLLADLLPTELPKITLFIAQQAQRFLKNEELFKSQWKATLVSSHLWFGLVRNVDNAIKKCGTKLHKNHRWFADQLFDGYDAIFTIHCLVEYSQTANCRHRLKLAIHLLFGDELLIKTEPENIDPETNTTND